MLVTCGYGVIENKVAWVVINNENQRVSYTLSRILRKRGDLVMTVHDDGIRSYSGYIDSSNIPEDIKEKLKL